MYEALCRFIEHLDEMERILQGQVYKLSIFDTLETMKLKMENYMERKINLGNIASEKPVAEWQPEEFTRFYTLYRPVLIRKDTETK